MSNEMIQLLRDEFAQDTPAAKETLWLWSQTPAQPPLGVADMLALLGRFEQAVQTVGLNGLAGYLHEVARLTDSLLQSAAAIEAPDVSDPMAQPRVEGSESPSDVAQSNIEVGVVWLVQWVDVAIAYLDNPAHPLIVEQMAAYLSLCPEPIDEDQVLELASLLMLPPTPSGFGNSTLGEAFELATVDDVSLKTEDVDPELLDALLVDAPQQLEQLEAAVSKWGAGQCSDAEMVEALRSAHTFKGSGNIIGLPGIGRLSHRLEDILEYALEGIRNGVLPPVGLTRDVMQAVHCLEQMVSHLQGEEAAPANAQEVLQRLLDWVAQVRTGDTILPLHEPLTSALQPQSALSSLRPEAERDDPKTAGFEAEVAMPIVTLGAPPKTADSTVMRVGVTQLARLLRRAGQSIIHTERLSNLLQEADNWLLALERNNQQMAGRLQELDLMVNSQVVQLRQVQAEHGNFDPLELDRYDALHGLSRFIGETSRDSSAMVQQARESANKSGVILREETFALVDQHRELLAARMVAVKSILPRLKRTVAQTALATGRQVALTVTGEDVVIDADVLARLAEPLLHLLRNAVDHGIELPQDRVLAGKPEQGLVQLDFRRVGEEVVLRVSDDGQGLNLAAIEAKALSYGLIDADKALTEPELQRLILHPGFSTRDRVTETSGRGVGMDIVNDRITGLKGRLEIDSAEGLGSFFTIHVPVSSGVAHALVVQCAGETVALPLEQVETIVAAGLADFSLEAVAGSSASTNAAGTSLVMTYAGEIYPAYALAQWLEVEDYSRGELLARASEWIAVIAHGSTGKIVLLVDAVLESRELILQEVGMLTRRVKGVIGGALRADGRPLFLLGVVDLQRAASAPRKVGAPLALRRRMQVERVHVLVVDDAWSVRRSMQQLLEDAGYEVATASDGYDALDRLRAKTPALVITDLEMPNLNGLELTRRMREIPQWAEVPVIMITSRASAKHRDEGLRAGVNIYLTKPYQDAQLLEQVRALTLDLSFD